jgi:hypothetical protein
MRIYEFVKEHVIPFNSVIAMAVTVAAVLDFLAPQAAYLAWLSYALAGLVMLAMGLEVRSQRMATSSNSWCTSVLNRLRAPPGPLWKSPAAPVAVVIGGIADAGSKMLKPPPNIVHATDTVLDIAGASAPGGFFKDVSITALKKIISIGADGTEPIKMNDVTQKSCQRGSY